LRTRTPTKDIVGYDIDIIKAVAQKAGLAIKIVNTPWTGIFAALNNGDVDLVISGVTINDKRRSRTTSRHPTSRRGNSSPCTRTAPPRA
jgi:polar amino acid transport system substrate-binding protein